MTTTTAPDAALLWARERTIRHYQAIRDHDYAKWVGDGLKDTTQDVVCRAEAFRAGQSHADAGLLAALEAIVAHCCEQERLVTEGLHHVTYCGESLPLCNARAAIAAAKGGRDAG